MLDVVVQVVIDLRAELKIGGHEVHTDKAGLTSTSLLAKEATDATGVPRKVCGIQVRRLGVDHALKGGLERAAVWVRRWSEYRLKFRRLCGCSRTGNGQRSHTTNQEHTSKTSHQREKLSNH